MGDKPYDFYSPFVRATIIASDGTRVPLWTNILDGATGSPVAGSASGFKDKYGLTSFPFLESASVSLSLSYMPVISVALTPPFLDGRTFINGPLIEWGQAVLEVILGYSAGTPQGAKLSEPFQGLLLKPDVAMGVGTAITLNAQGFAGYNSTITQSSKVHRNKSRIDIIKATAKGYGDPPRDLEVDVQFINDSTVQSLLDEETDESQGNRTDWMFMTQLARDCRCWLTLSTDGKSLILRSLPDSLAEDPKFIFRLYDFVPDVSSNGAALGPTTQNTDLDSGDFPILAVSSPSEQVFYPGATKALILQGINSSTGETVNEAITDQNSDAIPSTGGGDKGVTPNKTLPGLNDSTKQGGAPASKDVNSKGTREQVKSAFQFDFTTGIKLNITTLGIPDIQPADIVAVRGVGDRFDWNYGVFGIRHNIGPGGFTTDLELVSNTSSLLGAVVKGQGKLNDQKPGPGGKKVEATPEPVLGDFKAGRSTG